MPGKATMAAKSAAVASAAMTAAPSATTATRVGLERQQRNDEEQRGGPAGAGRQQRRWRTGQSSCRGRGGSLSLCPQTRSLQRHVPPLARLTTYAFNHHCPVMKDRFWHCGQCAARTPCRARRGRTSSQKNGCSTRELTKGRAIAPMPPLLMVG